MPDTIHPDVLEANCPFCEQPIVGEAGRMFGKDLLHTRCYRRLGEELAVLDDDSPWPSEDEFYPGDPLQLITAMEEEEAVPF